MDNLQLEQVPITKTGMLIRKPVTDVFEAFVNPDITTKFWFTRSRGAISMDEASITHYIIDTFEGIQTVTADGNTFFFYDPDRKFPFATLVTNDAYDQVSNLNR